MVKIGGPYAEPMKGRGYFNEAQGTSAGMAKQIKKVQEGYTTRDGDKTDINIDPSYHEAMDAAWRAYQPEAVKNKPAVSLWEMPWRERDAYVALLQGEGCYSEEDYKALEQQAEMFGLDSLSNGGRALVEKGRDMFDAGTSYINQVSLSPSASHEDYMDDLHDTGRYVQLQGPGGAVSQYLMELRPMMDVHRFLDLEAPEGQAQILEFREGDYKVFSEYGNCELVQDGIAAAREYKAERGTIYATELGTVSQSELLTQFQSTPMQPYEVRAGHDEPYAADLQEGPAASVTAAQPGAWDELMGRNAQTDADAPDAPGGEKEIV